MSAPPPAFVEDRDAGAASLQIRHAHPAVKAHFVMDESELILGLAVTAGLLPGE